MRQLATVLLLLWSALYATAQRFNINCNSNMVMYWGQNSHAVGNPNENQLPLDEYCDKNTGDVLVLSFLSEFNADRLHPPTINFANSCVTSFDNSTLLHCSNIGKAVKKCQKQGKVVLLSLGGASGAYGFADDVQAERYADQIWDMFLGGSADRRPFDGSVLDGIDLDIEGGSSVGYVRFVQRLRERFTEVPNRRFYVTAAPQCPYPDFYAGPILDNAYLDMVFVQFYNNYCGLDHPNWYNFEQWHEWATTVSANKDVRVYMGVPGSPSAASTGHVPPDRLEEIVNATRSKFSSFGGMMVWDASQADYNHVSEDQTFAALARRMLDSGKKCTDGSDATAEDETDDASDNSSNSESSSSSRVSSKSSSSTMESSKSTDSNKSDTESSSTLSTTDTSSSSAMSSSSAAVNKNAVSTGKPKSTKVKPTSRDKRDEDHFANEHLNRVAVGSLEDSTEETTTEDSTTEDSTSNESSSDADSTKDSQEDAAATDSSSTESTDIDSDASVSEVDAETTADDAAETTADDSAETTEDGAAESTDNTAETTDNSAETTEDAAETTEEEERVQSSSEEGDETTTVASTKVLHETITKTRKIHIMTKHVTTRIQKMANGDLGSLTEPSPTTANKSISIVTPTFPLPIARCPRADQPCLGAGFACNGYEFGQCVNGRWLMRPCSTDRVTACFNAGPDLVACDFPKGRSLQVCDDILAPLPYGRLASNVLFLRGSDQERALNTPVYPIASSTPSATTHVKKKKDDDDDDSDTDDDDDDYQYNKYGEKKKNTATTTTTDMELIKQSSGVNLIDDHNRREDPAMLMVKDPEAYYGPDGHVRVVAGNVVDDMRKHNSMGTDHEPYDENPPVDDPEEGDEYSDGDEFMRKRDQGVWSEEDLAASSVPLAPESTAPAEQDKQATHSGHLAVRDTQDLVGSSVSMAHLGEKPWRAQVEDFLSIYALYSTFSGISNDMAHQQFERIILKHIDGDFLVPPNLPAMEGHPLLAHFTFVPVHGEDPDYMHHRTKDGMVEQDILVIVRALTNTPFPKRWRVALPLPLHATMLHTSRGSFFAGNRVSAEVKSTYMQRVAFYNENIRLHTNKKQKGPELQRLDDMAAGHSSNSTESADREFNDGPGYDSVRRSLISSSVISEVLHKKPSSPPPPELLDEPVPNDPAGRLYEVRSDPNTEKERSMALYFNIRIKTHANPQGHVVGALPHPILSFITTY
ncbi:Chitinase 2 [Coemansia sp. RSA 2131]|nr:Chitinase 2 [Coemansia sp. RSA 2131]